MMYVYYCFKVFSVPYVCIQGMIYSSHTLYTKKIRKRETFFVSTAFIQEQDTLRIAPHTALS